MIGNELLTESRDRRAEFVEWPEQFHLSWRRIKNCYILLYLHHVALNHCFGNFHLPHCNNNLGIWKLAGFPVCTDLLQVCTIKQSFMGLVHFAGQIELYSHIPVLRTFVDQLKRWDFNVCAVYMLDSQVFTPSSVHLSAVFFNHQGHSICWNPCSAQIQTRMVASISDSFLEEFVRVDWLILWNQSLKNRPWLPPCLFGFAVCFRCDQVY